MEIREATLEDAATVGELAYRLVWEIAPGARDQLSLEAYRSCAAALLGGNARYWALLAHGPDGAAVGLLTLNEYAAIYAGGAFGEIAELYVAEEQRSQGLAAALVEAARDFARDKGWTRLEVGAPDQPRWHRTVNFYLKEGFAEVGPRLRFIL